MSEDSKKKVLLIKKINKLREQLGNSSIDSDQFDRYYAMTIKQLSELEFNYRAKLDYVQDLG